MGVRTKVLHTSRARGSALAVKRDSLELVIFQKP
jgi:hypothetical protein